MEIIYGRKVDENKLRSNIFRGIVHDYAVDADVDREIQPFILGREILPQVNQLLGKKYYRFYIECGKHLQTSVIGYYRGERGENMKTYLTDTDLGKLVSLFETQTDTGR